MTTDHDDVTRMRILLRAARTDRFAPGFANRVVRAASAEAEGPSLALLLVPQFIRLAPAALALIVGLFVYNVWVAGGGRPTLEEALGVPPVSIAEAYSMSYVLQADPPRGAGR